MLQPNHTLVHLPTICPLPIESHSYCYTYEHCSGVACCGEPRQLPFQYHDADSPN